MYLGQNMQNQIYLANFIKNLVKRIYHFPKLVDQIMMNMICVTYKSEP